MMLAVVMLAGCKSKQDAAIDQAKKQAAATGQAQQVVSTDSNGNVTTTTVQPPAPGQTAQAVTTTTTPASPTATVASNTPATAPGAAMSPDGGQAATGRLWAGRFFGTALGSSALQVLRRLCDRQM